MDISIAKNGKLLSPSIAARRVKRQWRSQVDLTPWLEIAHLHRTAFGAVQVTTITVRGSQCQSERVSSRGSEATVAIPFCFVRLDGDCHAAQNAARNDITGL